MVDAELAKIRAAAEAYADTPRPWRTAVVLDNSAYSTTGPAYLQVELDGVSRRVVLSTPSAKPAIGDVVQVKRADSDAGAYWLALPLPRATVPPPAPGSVCPDHRWYVSAQSGGTWKILKLDTADGVPTWSVASTSPTSGSERCLFWLTTRAVPAFPYHGFADGVSDLGLSFGVRFFTHGPGAGLYYSDDFCQTWTSSGLSPVYVARDEYFGLMHACTAGSLYRSYDYGATWSAIAGSAPPSGNWRFVTSPVKSNLISDSRGNSLDFQPNGVLRTGNTSKHRAIAAVADGGQWYSLNEFAPHAYPVDEADPVFSGEDPQLRSWVDGGSNDGGFTVDSSLFGIPLHKTFPFVVAKVYRDRYGPYGAAVPAGRRPFYAWGYQQQYIGPRYRPDSSAFIEVAYPDRSELPAASDPYDESALKPTGASENRVGGDVGHINVNSYGHNPLLVFPDDGLGTGGVVWLYSATDMIYWSHRDHPGGLDAPVADACAHNNAGQVCYLIGLDDSSGATGHSSFLLTSYARTLVPATGPGGGTYRANDHPCVDASAAMVSQLGARYIASPDGIAAHQNDGNNGA